jgi:hypothetical protein
MNLLKAKGYYTTGDDGMHCHFGADDLNESDIVRVIRSWDNNSNIIQKFLGERFHNDYCGYGYDWNYLEGERMNMAKSILFGNMMEKSASLLSLALTFAL